METDSSYAIILDMQKSVHLKALMLFLVLCFIVGSAVAQSGSLYGRSLEESAILVRLINLQSDGSASVRVGAKRITAPAPGDVTDYYPISADLYILRYRGVNLEFIPKVGTIYSITAREDGLVVLVDNPQTNPAKSQIILYVQPGNSGTKLSLKTSDGTTTVIPDVASGGSGSVSVNPVSVSLGLFSPDGTMVSDAFQLDLQRGESLALTARRSSGGRYILTSSRADISAQ